MAAQTIAVAIGAPNAAERTGTWINIDGHSGRLAAARPAPPEVPALTRTLEDLIAAVRSPKNSNASCDVTRPASERPDATEGVQA